jgi:glycosyltransferase involved in cell wall biosynthesis
MAKKYLSIIIPAYNEERNIAKTLGSLLKYFKKTPYRYEVIVVSDGSTDKTASKANRFDKKLVRVFEYKTNHGKGYALKYGVRRTRGKVVALTDAGGDFHPSHIDRFVKLMEVFDADVVIGSKRHPASVVNYPTKRRFYSRIYQLLIRLLFNLNIRDTQAGIKVFKKEVLQKILPRILVKQYAFDLELLVAAKRMGFNKIYEAPVHLNFNPATSGINPTTIWHILQDTAAIFYRAKIRRWYNKKT